MKKIIITLAIIGLIPWTLTLAEEKKIEGEISLSGKYIGVDAEGGGEAKFTEYRDLKENGGFYGRARLRYDTERYFLHFKAAEVGYDTQRYQLEGGMWGKFKYDLFYHEIPHHITFDARTFFLGAGSDTLIGGPNTNVGSWNTFDYSFERRQYGGGLKLNLIKPFFLNVSFQREEREGIKPNGVAGTSPGGIGVELPEPIDYITNHLALETGYAKNPLFLSFNYFYSGFNNSNTTLNFRNPSTGAQDTLSLPPDHTYHKGAFKASVKLPFQSRISGNIGFAKGKSESSAFPTLTGGRTDFKGEVETFNYDLALTSHPVPFLDAKVFHKFYKRNNRSDEVVGIVEHFFDYKIQQVGAELGFKLPLRFHVQGGYQFVKTDREFIKAFQNPSLVLPFNKDHIYSVELRWSGLDWMDLRLGYERMDRKAKERTPQAEAQPNKMYAYDSQDRDTFKASLDFFPWESLNFGLEYRHKKSDYDGTFGLKKDKRDEIATNVAYTLGKTAKIYGNVDFAWVTFHPDLVRTQAATDFPWSAKQKDKTFGYGLGTEIYVIPNKLTFLFQHDFLKSNGNIDFSIHPALLVAANGLAGANNDIVDIMRSEDYILYSFKFKTNYQITKSLIASLGYAYQRFSYRDDQLDHYQYVNPLGGPVTGTNGAYLTGAYKDQSYKAHLISLGLTYRF
ncbi:MAG: MtrB/PioB family outer membrane beta-barrel protein [Treponemataceae bacterium]|nr:MtrB/PioB family outer membrane beta-barrel protein [Treponemataceae bacterium]